MKAHIWQDQGLLFKLMALIKAYCIKEINIRAAFLGGRGDVQLFYFVKIYKILEIKIWTIQ